MAKLGQAFDATEHDTDQQGDFPTLPLGIYRLEITASDVVKKDTGDVVLKTTSDVIAPEEFKGRKVFGNFNLEHSSQQAQEIGQKQFAQQCRAVGLFTVEDSEELHFIAYTAKIGVGKDSKEKNQDGTPKYPGREEVKKYFYPDEGNVPEPEILAPGAPASSKPAQAATEKKERAAPPAEKKARPWGNK